MSPITELSVAQAGSVRYVLTDIDDTLTEKGRLGADAYASLWALKRADIRVVPVTGRPAGWCDLIARQWPVDGVVGENGAFAFFVQDGRLCEIHHPSIPEASVREKLDVVRARVLAEVPGSRIAKDQFSRIYDLAIDYREEPPDLGLEAAERIAEICRGLGAEAKVSSIHVNAWYGDYDKLSMAQLFLDQRWGENLERLPEIVLFAGDSPNDEPMFAHFPLSCGVANLRSMEGIIAHHPKFITRLPFGDGFAEMVEILLDRRSRADLDNRSDLG